VAFDCVAIKAKMPVSAKPFKALETQTERRFRNQLEP
jgi:hypothetical protein